MQEKVDDDPPPIFEWIIEMPSHKAKHLEQLDSKRASRRSYYDSRHPSKEVSEPNRVLHDHKLATMQAFMKGVNRNPKVLERAVEEKRSEGSDKKKTVSFANFESKVQDDKTQRSFEKPVRSASASRLRWSFSIS